MAIEGKVAKVLDARALIVNRGSLAGVQPEMRFKVLEEEVDVMDPDNDIFFGTLEREKVRIKITEAHPMFSVGRTYENYQTTVGYVGPDFLAAIGSPRSVTKVRTLKTQGDPIANFDENVAAVVTEDKVIQLESESHSDTIEN